MSTANSFKCTKFANGEYMGEDASDGLGMFVWDSGKYYLGQWVSESICGLGLHRFEDNTVFFGECEDVDTFTRGVQLEKNQAIIILKRTGSGKKTRIHRIVIDTTTGWWRFSVTNDDSEEIGTSFTYDPQKSALYFTNNDTGFSSVVDQKYQTKRPLICHLNPCFKTIPYYSKHYDSCEFENGTDDDGEEYSNYYYYPNPKDKKCIAALRYEDGNFYIGEYDDGMNGFGLFTYIDSFEVAYAVDAENNGLYVQFWDSGEVSVCIKKHDSIVSSTIYFFDDETIVYGDTNNDDQFDGPAFLVDLNQKSVNFFNYNEGDADSSDYMYFLDGESEDEDEDYDGEEDDDEEENDDEEDDEVDEYDGDGEKDDEYDEGKEDDDEDEDDEVDKPEVKKVYDKGAREELNELIGLGSVKETIDNLVAYFSMNKGRTVSFHMSFLGNPGTGKTVVARLLGRLLHEEGLLPTDRFFECTRNDFIGQYLGHTAKKTLKTIQKAMGGVLFIDEAYSLCTDSQDSFGKEAISELLKQMEDHRGEFCVIMAGYHQEMQWLYDTNPGFQSRVKFHLDFPDYSRDELYKIAQIYLKKDDYHMDDQILNTLIDIIYAQREERNYANARTLRDSISSIEIKQAGRLRKEGKNNRDLLLEDLIAHFGEEVVKSAQQHSNEGDADSQKVPMVPLSFIKKEYEQTPLIKYQEDMRHISDAVVAIKTDCSESSGFIFTSNGYVATCAHCVRGAKELKVRQRIVHNGRNKDTYYNAEVVAVNDDWDVAIIKIVSDEEFDYLVLAPEDFKDLSPLSRILILGYPFGVSCFDEMSVNEGKIASYQRMKQINGLPDQINLDVSAKSGNSGSCVLEENNWLVIGILCGSSTSESGNLVEEINYCRPISYIWELIKNNQ